MRLQRLGAKSLGFLKSLLNFEEAPQILAISGNPLLLSARLEQ